MLDKIIDVFGDQEILVAVGFEKAVIGMDEHSGRLVYSVSKCLDTLVADGMSAEEALDFFNFNVSGSYVGGKNSYMVPR